jgi:4-diphosphocytidyl-2-C-methyl-D-erythritol kinase
VRAYERLSKSPPVHIHLVKNVPIGRGLGGGSSDAATTLMGLSVYSNGRSIQSKCLRNFGNSVPTYHSSRSRQAEGTGRGDEVGRLDDETDYWLVLIDPGLISHGRAVFVVDRL